MKIEVDQEIFEFLKKNAIPFKETTPNSVLRRLLLKKNRIDSPSREVLKESHALDQYNGKTRTEDFVHIVLKREFGEGFRVGERYRMMFESQEKLVYFQNFNAESDKLWFRINERPLKRLRGSNKVSIICLTNPAEKFAYIIPLSEIEKQIQKSGWRRDYLEVNIDQRTSRWGELDWIIREYIREY